MAKKLRPRGRPFIQGRSGNPAGRPKGVRNQTTVALEALLEGEAEALARKAIDLALGGDINALRLCLERIYPPRRERFLYFEMPELKASSDAAGAISALVAAVAAGFLMPSEASELMRLIDGFVKACERSGEAASNTFDPMAALRAHVASRQGDAA